MYKDVNHYTLYQRGKIWGYYYYDEDNKRHFRSTGRKTKTEAMKVINSRLSKGSLKLDGVRKSMLFKDYAVTFFIPGKCPLEKERSRVGSALSVSTMKLNRNKLDSDLIPYFGMKKLDDIKKSDIVSFEDKCMDEGLKNRSITIKTNVLRLVLGYARRNGDMSSDPFEGHVALKEETSSRQAFSLDQVRDMLSVDWKSYLARDAFLWSCLTGMRRGEIQALKVGSVRDGVITVSHSYSQELGVEKDTKSHKTREIPFPSALQSVYDALSRGKDPDMLLFSLDGATHLGSWEITRGVISAKQKCGIENSNLTFHSCRHFFDTYMALNTGLSPEKVMSVMGHQNLEMYQHYLHVVRTDLGEIREEQEKLTTKLTTDKK